MAKIETGSLVSFGNSIPKNSWIQVTQTTGTLVNVASNQCCVVLRLNDDGFWGVVYTPTANGNIALDYNSVYCLFTKPSTMSDTGLGVAFFSSTFNDPVLIINGTDTLADNRPFSNSSYYKFDIRKYFE